MNKFGQVLLARSTLTIYDRGHPVGLGNLFCPVVDVGTGKAEKKKKKKKRKKGLKAEFTMLTVTAKLSLRYKFKNTLYELKIEVYYSDITYEDLGNE